MIRVLTIRQTCSACPSQWQGVTDDGKIIYVRYRWGVLEVGVGSLKRDAVAATFGPDCIRQQLGGDFDGYLSYDQLVGATAGQIEWPGKQGA